MLTGQELDGWGPRHSTQLGQGRFRTDRAMPLILPQAESWLSLPSDLPLTTDGEKHICFIARFLTFSAQLYSSCSTFVVSCRFSCFTLATCCSERVFTDKIIPVKQFTQDLFYNVKQQSAEQHTLGLF